MREITANPRITIPLGRQGENNAVRVKFPISSWNELYGNGAFELLNVRPNEKTPYTCSITADDDFVYWVVQSADVAIVGHGKCELTYVVDGTVAKSVTFGTCVFESIEGAGTVPAPYESRIADLIEASANITVEADRAETAREGAEEAERSILGLSATASIDNNIGTPSVDVEVTDEEDHKNMDFAFHNLKGEKGDKGDKGDTGEQGPKGETGDTGAQGPKGDKGDTGATGAKGDKGDQGIQGEKGEKGDKGDTGAKGDKGDPGEVTQAELDAAVDEIQDQIGDLTQLETDNKTDLVSAVNEAATKGGGASAIVKTASGTIASFDDGVADSKVQKLVVNIEPVQSGTGDPSPDNVRPITGWTEANVVRTGKNLFDEATYKNIFSTYEYISETYRCASIQLTPNTSYTVSQRAGVADSSVIALINSVPSVNSGGYFDLRSASESKIFTTDATGKLYIGALYSTDEAYNARLALCKIQIELGTEATDYEPYQGDTYDITFPAEAGTVYGGTLDVTSGVLTVDRAKRIISSFEGAWGATNNGYAVYIDSTARSLNRNIAKCNQFKIDGNSYSTMPLYSFLGGSGAQSTWTFILPSSVTSLAEANEWLSNLTTPLETIYALDTPATYTLTAQQITTLLGTNNIWADTGDVEVTYYADSKTYIDDQNTLVKALIAPVLDSMVADTALVKNDFRIVNNTLYRATTAIASGATLTVGTNVVATTLAEVIKPLLT